MGSLGQGSTVAISAGYRRTELEERREWRRISRTICVSDSKRCFGHGPGSVFHGGFELVEVAMTKKRSFYDLARRVIGYLLLIRLFQQTTSGSVEGCRG